MESFRMKSLSSSRGKHIFKIFIYLFLAALDLGYWVWASSSCGEQSVERLLSSCSVQVPHCSAFSCCRARALGMCTSVVEALRLSPSVACGIFPDQELNLCPLHWQAILIHHASREVQSVLHFLHTLFLLLLDQLHFRSSGLRSWC